ncbi:MAG: HU family DNA-binding protein [Patescibacteria group bacterium]|jgi:DNA-binding protein HU-beta
MNKAELMETLAAKAGVTKKQAEDVMQAFENLVIERLRAGSEVTLTGFGTFLARVRESRMGVNPQNPSERIRIPTVTVPKFKSGKALKDGLKTHAEPTTTATPEKPSGD